MRPYFIWSFKLNYIEYTFHDNVKVCCAVPVAWLNTHHVSERTGLPELIHKGPTLSDDITPQTPTGVCSVVVDDMTPQTQTGVCSVVVDDMTPQTHIGVCSVVVVSRCRLVSNSRDVIEEHLSVHQVSVQQQHQQEPEYSTLSDCFQLYTQEETVS